MTIDEAIAKLRSNAIMDKYNMCGYSMKQHEQLAEWLEELKELRSTSCGFTKEDIELNRTAMYNKAIDDFAERLATYLGVENATKYGNKNAEQQRNSYDTWMKYEVADAIDDVAEQLKAGN